MDSYEKQKKMNVDLFLLTSCIVVFIYEDVVDGNFSSGKVKTRN